MDETQMQHGRQWRGQTVRGWFASEKYRGVRVEWDGHEMWSRGGLQVALPAAWRAELPAGCALAGEVWAGRGPENGPEETEAAAAVVRGEFTDRLRLMVFDAPDAGGNWIQRMSRAAGLLQGAKIVRPVGFQTVRSLPHLEELFAAVKAKGGEGLMLRHPSAEYSIGRTGQLLKVKMDPALARGAVRFAA